MTLMYYTDMPGQYTIKDLAKKLKVSARTILREIQRGILKTNKVGKKYLITNAQLEAYLTRAPSQSPSANKSKSNVKEHLSKFCDAHKHEMVTLLQNLVTIPAESNTDGEEELAKYLKKELEKLDIISFIHKGEDSVILRGSFGYADKGLLLDCPLDTTPAGDLKKWTYPPFEGVVYNGKMYGRGTADCKAGMVCMIYALLALNQVIDKDKVRVELVFDGGEQSGGYLGMKTFLEMGLPVSAGIVGYASSWKDLTIGARGYHRYTFTSHGESAHTGSRSKIGVNAISNMCKFITRLEKEKFPKSKNKYFPFGSRLTFAQIEGGRAINIVPDICTARLDVRITPDLDKSFVDKKIARVLKELKAKDDTINIEYKYDLGQEGYILKENEKVQRDLLDAITDVAGIVPEISATGPAHIGNLLAEHDIPVVLWGPKGSNVHSYDEYVEIESLAQTAKIYALTILKFFGIQ